MELTTIEKDILLFIGDYIRTHNQSPTLSEIRDHFGYKSLTSVQRPISSLYKKGLLKIETNVKRGISIRQKSTQVVNIPIIGSIAAGNPILAYEDVEGYIPTDTHFVKGNIKDYFYLRVRGDSMDLAGINDGDLVLVRSQQQANDGEKVVALIDDSATVKIFKKGDGFISLIPKSTNTDHKPIILRESFRIQGVVLKVIQE